MSFFDRSEPLFFPRRGSGSTRIVRERPERAVSVPNDDRSNRSNAGGGTSCARRRTRNPSPCRDLRVPVGHVPVLAERPPDALLVVHARVLATGGDQRFGRVERDGHQPPRGSRSPADRRRTAPRNLRPSVWVDARCVNSNDLRPLPDRLCRANRAAAWSFADNEGRNAADSSSVTSRTSPSTNPPAFLRTTPRILENSLETRLFGAPVFRGGVSPPARRAGSPPPASRRGLERLLHAHVQGFAPRPTHERPQRRRETTPRSICSAMSRLPWFSHRALF